eukprot:TRINITY_DN6054_c0_g1_i1.p1 TRINITY_DN6054_c0_g1~~TRINITY_DN6054_c0_g1_i1.p1  ORF type:complete len:150 (-),score=3.21 TRINITY_DN6054_c0_g1_i1:254-703(-)
MLLAHLVVERARYQFALAYAFLGYTLFWDIQSVVGGTEFFRPLWFVGLSIVIYVGSSAIACLIPVIKFDKLQGALKFVGCSVSHLKGKFGGKKMSFMIRVFYPAETIQGHKESDYMPNGTLTTNAYAKFGVNNLVHLLTPCIGKIRLFY